MCKNYETRSHTVTIKSEVFLKFFGGGGGEGNFVILCTGAIMLLTTGRIGMFGFSSFKLISVPEVQILLE